MSKVETFTDSFTSLSNWRAETPSYTSYFPTYSAVSGHLQADLTNSAGVAIGAMVSTGTYTFENSWMSLEVTDYNLTAASYYIPFFIESFDEATETAYDTTGLFVNYPSAGNCTISSSGALSSFTTPVSGSIIIAQRSQAGSCYGFYSLDSGVTWVQVGDGTTATARPSDAPYHVLIISELLENSGADAIVTADNFNSHMPPMGVPSGPISIAAPVAIVTVTAPIPYAGALFVPAAHVTAHGGTTMAVILNDLTAVSRSAAVPAMAVVSAPVTGMTVHLGLKVDMPAPAIAIGTGVPTVGFIYGPPTIAVAPGIVAAVAKAPTLTLSTGTIFIAAPTANIQGDGGSHIHVIVGSFIVGDHWYYPITIRDAGTATYTGATYSGDDGLDVASGTSSFGLGEAGMWFYYQADTIEDVTFTVSGPPSFLFRVFQGDNALDGWTPIAQMGFTLDTEASAGPYTAGNTLTASLTTGITRLWLSWPSTLGGLYTTGTLTWSYVPTATGLLMDIANPTLDRSPDNLRVSVLGGASNEDLKFVWSPPASILIPSSIPRPITLATIRSDAEGNLLTGTIPLPAAFHGSYVLECIGQDSGRIAIASFHILNDPLPQDSDSADVDPVDAPSTKWFWDDARGHTWSMVNSPSTMSRVVFPKNLTAEHTTSGTGQHIIWQGIVPAVEGQFSGTVLTQAEYEQFEFFLGLNRKFYITNHRDKTYIVTLKSFDPKPHKTGGNPWAFDYTCTAIVYGTKGGD